MRSRSALGGPPRDGRAAFLHRRRLIDVRNLNKVLASTSARPDRARVVLSVPAAVLDWFRGSAGARSRTFAPKPPSPPRRWAVPLLHIHTAASLALSSATSVVKLVDRRARCSAAAQETGAVPLAIGALPFGLSTRHAAPGPAPQARARVEVAPSMVRAFAEAPEGYLYAFQCAIETSGGLLRRAFLRYGRPRRPRAVGAPGKKKLSEAAGSRCCSRPPTRARGSCSIRATTRPPRPDLLVRRAQIAPIPEYHREVDRRLQRRGPRYATEIYCEHASARRFMAEVRTYARKTRSSRPRRRAPESSRTRRASSWARTPTPS